VILVSVFGDPLFEVKESMINLGRYREMFSTSEALLMRRSCGVEPRFGGAQS
jgi:hypothetical protein